MVGDLAALLTTARVGEVATAMVPVPSAADRGAHRQHHGDRRHALPSVGGAELASALAGADVLITSTSLDAVPSIPPAVLKRMARRPVLICSLGSEPRADLGPIAGRFAILATLDPEHLGRANCALPVAGLLRGLLDARATTVTKAQLDASATALADLVPHPQSDRLLPRGTEPAIVSAVARAVEAATAVEDTQ